MRKFLSCILCVITLLSVVSFTGCKDKNEVGKAWQVVTFGTSESSIIQKVGFKVTRNSNKIKDVWLNVESIEGNSVTVNFTKYKKNTDEGEDLYSQGEALDGGDIVISAETVKKANKETKGWIKINTKDWNLSNDNVLLTIKEGRLTIREIVFVNNKNEQLSAKVDVAYVAIKTDKKAQPQVGHFTLAQLEEFAETSIYGVPTFLLDSQDSFKEKDKKD